MFLNNYINDKNYKIIICRFSNFYGRGQPLYRLIPKLIWYLKITKNFPFKEQVIQKGILFDEDFNDGLLKGLEQWKNWIKISFRVQNFIS